MDCKKEVENRIAFIKQLLDESKTNGIVFGNSGGKDSALVGILCKMACENTTGIIMPCSSARNFTSDKDDGEILAQQYGIKTLLVDITPAKEAMSECLGSVFELGEDASSNINPRLRMITLYAYARENNLLVAGTGNRSERFMGYFTKWGDGACDFNPIGDLLVSEIYELLEYLKAPESIIKKAPSAALKEGQTDEADMGVSYDEIEKYILDGPESVNEASRKIIERMHRVSEHKRILPPIYKRN